MKSFEVSKHWMLGRLAIAKKIRLNAESLESRKRFLIYRVCIDSKGGICEGCRPAAWKISRQILFLGQAQVAQKSWMIKNISIQWKFSGQLCFSGLVQIAQISWMWKVYSVQWKFPAKLCFSRQAQSCSKILNGEKLFNTVHSVCIH